MTGGNSGSASGTRFTAPGLGNIYGADFPGVGLGEQAAQVRLATGVLNKLSVSVVTDGTQTSGSVTVMVRLNGADTALTCSVSFGGGNCKTVADVVIAASDGVAIRVVSTLDAGAWTFSYTLLFD